MPIAYQEQARLTCPACGAELEAPIWLILDAQEQPDALAALLRDELNLVRCTACGYAGPAGAPLLYHDGLVRRVIFAPSPGLAEHEWREQARELHALLVGSIAEEQRRAYLGEVEIAQDVAGIGHLLRRAAQRRSARPTPTPVAATPPASTPPSEPTPPLLVAVEALLGADTPTDLERILASHPLLLEPAADATLAELAEVAQNQGDPAIAASLREARALLARLVAAAQAQQPASPNLPAALPDEVLQALLKACSARELAAAVADNPLLAEPGADRLIAARIELALDEGDERMALALEERREALLQLLAARLTPGTGNETTLDEALEALLIAEDEPAIAAVLDRYPQLLTAPADEALWQFAAEARASGDEELARYAVACREMLRRIREGLAQ